MSDERTARDVIAAALVSLNDGVSRGGVEGWADEIKAALEAEGFKIVKESEEPDG